MATTRPLAHLGTNFPWLHRWIYYLAAGIMYAAATLRATIIFQNGPVLGWILLLLGVWLLLIIGATLFTRRLPWLTAFVFVLDAGLIFILLLITGQDFFAFLYAILGMRAMQQYSPKVVGGLIGLCAILTFLALIGSNGLLNSLAQALTYSALGAFLAAYIWSTRQAGVIQQEQQALVEELQQANHRLEYHARQQEQLAAGRERQRLARELHDSVTQTIFSMTLTTQSALLLLERDRVQVKGQLDRLDQLSQGAMAEMQELISRLAPEAVSGDFITILQHHLEERRRLDNLMVTLEVEGDQPLDSAEQSNLFRIAQEALNNIVKHARVNQALIRLHLEESFWMEIEDSGCGFDKQQALGRERMGMAGMGERATEMGWTLQVTSSPGSGTRIRVEKRTPGEKHP